MISNPYFAMIEFAKIPAAHTPNQVYACGVRRKSHERKILWVLFGGLLLLVLVTFVVLILGGRDEEPYLAGDLQRDIPKFSNEEDNARFWFRRATEELMWPSEAMDLLSEIRGGNEESLAELAVWLEKNQVAYELVKDGNTRTRAVNPDAVNYLDIVGDAGDWMKMLLMLSARYEYALHQDDMSKALTETEEMFRFASLVFADAESFVIAIIASPLVAKPLGYFADLSRDDRIGSVDLERIARLFEDSSWLESGLTAALKGEHEGFGMLLRLIGKEGLDDNFIDVLSYSEEWQAILNVLRFRIFSRYLIHPERSIRRHAEAARQALTLWEDPLAGEQTPWFSRQLPEMSLVEAISRNGYGTRMADMAATAFPYMLSRYLNLRRDVNALRVVVALERHRREHGAYPATIQALVPAYLDALPVDPFTGEEFRYDAQLGVVLSTGGEGMMENEQLPSKAEG